ncbi:MAG: peptide MFS transporter [Gemmatimonadaceae bacterium]|nr:peptide MFS transporter [Gemmatimonadaceae bacterium]
MSPDKSVFEQPKAGTVTLDETPDLKEWTGNRGFFGHPRGLSTLFFTEMWERFSYYGLRPLLVLFMSATVLNGGYGFDRTQASAIVGIYAAFVYLMSLPGGWVADRLLGLRRAILIGAALISAGHISIGLSGLLGLGAGKVPFFAGLILIVLGTGLLKPNISAIVGDLYPEGGARRDAGFSIFYMGINVGALLGQLVTGYLGEQVNWHIGMGAAGVAMLIGLTIYGLRATKTLGPIGMVPSRHADPAIQAKQERTVKTFVASFLVSIILVFALAATGAVELNPAGIAEYMTYAMIAMAVGFFAFVFVFGHLSGDEKKRVGVIVVLFAFAAIFWSAFEQAPTALNLFARDFTDRTVGGFEIPATWFQSVNPLMIIIFAPMFAGLWVGLAKRGGDFSSPAKFSLGLFLAGIGFLIMIFAANAVVASGGATLVSPWWLVGSYFFQSIGELCLSPVGLSSMTKLSPRRYVSQMMGIWFLASALGNLIGGRVGGHVDPEKLDQMPQLFTTTTISLMVAAGILVLLIVPIRRMMSDTPAGNR